MEGEIKTQKNSDDRWCQELEDAAIQSRILRLKGLSHALLPPSSSSRWGHGRQSETVDTETFNKFSDDQV